MSEHYVRVKVNDLKGIALDWAVCAADESGKCERRPDYIDGKLGCWQESESLLFSRYFIPYSPSQDWADCGALIDKFNIELKHEPSCYYETRAAIIYQDHEEYAWGKDIKDAACKVVVMSKSDLDETVSIPKWVADISGVPYD